MCDFCAKDEDDATHTPRYCENWNTQRAQLVEKLRLDAEFTLMDVVGVISTSNEAWRAFSAFAEDVMRKNEEEERRRERARDLSPLPFPC